MRASSRRAPPPARRAAVRCSALSRANALPAASAALRGRSISIGREPGKAADEPPHALALARKVRARRMAREAPREPRDRKRALVDGGARARP